MTNASNLNVHTWPTWLRWLLFIPAAFLVSSIPQFIVGYLNVVGSGGNSFLAFTSIPSLVSLFGAAALYGYLFVRVGSTLVPDHKKGISQLLLAFVLIAQGWPLLSFLVSPDFSLQTLIPIALINILPMISAWVAMKEQTGELKLKKQAGWVATIAIIAEIARLAIQIVLYWTTSHGILGLIFAIVIFPIALPLGFGALVGSGAINFVTLIGEWAVLLALYYVFNSGFPKKKAEQFTKVDDDRVFITCAKCSKKLWFKKGQGIIKTRCPGCKNEATITT